MIFSQLFSPKYKSSDPEKRIASIETLNKDAEKDIGILHELAFNDVSETVSLAALTKLDSFVLWMQSADTSASVRIKKHAQQVCLSQLEDATKVSEKMFLTFVKESKNKALLEQMLFTSNRLQQQPLAVDVLLLLNNNAHTRRFFQEFALPEQQLAIINNTTDAKTLNRLAKHVKDESISLLINNKLDSIAELAQKPNKIKQQMTMINSRLLALRGAQDFEYLSLQFKQLSSEFEQLKTQFNCLDELTKATMTDKYLSLKVDIQQKLAKLEEGHNAQLLLKQTSSDLSNIQERCTQVQTQIDLISGVSENNENINSNIDAEVKILTSALVDASEELLEVSAKAQTQAHNAKIKQLTSQIANMQTSLLQVYDVVEFAQKGSNIELELSALTTNFASEEVPRKITQQELAELRLQLTAQKGAFEQLKKDANGLLPASTISAFSKTLANANKLARQFGQQFKDLENKCDAKLKTVNRMIKDGKFKAAMSTFFHAKKMYENIGEHAHSRLQKAFEQTEVEVNKLQDWQSYIAQPRKPAMLEKAQQLAESEFEDPYERTQQVKQLRQEWSSLGQLHTQEDEAHNRAFDAYIEKAFVPCRAFFAALERQREENYHKALGLIEEAKGLNAEMTASELSAKMSALKARFNKLGEIDKAKVNKLRREFTKIFKPLSFVISKEQSLHAEQKQTLIKQLLKLGEESTGDELLSEAVDKAKTLQQKWKEVGFAGKAVDDKLWHDFRQANDALFERYHQNIDTKKSAQQQQLNELDADINNIVKEIKAASSIADLQFYEQAHNDILVKVQESDEATQKRLQQKLRKMEDAHEASLKQLNRVRDESALSNLFAFLRSYEAKSYDSESYDAKNDDAKNDDSHNFPDQYEDLLGRYKSWVNAQIPSISLLEGLNRIALTQVAAILFDIAFNDVPVGDKAIRQDLQLKLMASKLQGDGDLDTELVLAKWVSLGPIQANEQESLQAMQLMYIG